MYNTSIRVFMSILQAMKSTLLRLRRAFFKGSVLNSTSVATGDRGTTRCKIVIHGRGLGAEVHWEEAASQGSGGSSVMNVFLGKSPDLEIDYLEID